MGGGQNGSVGQRFHHNLSTKAIGGYPLPQNFLIGFVKILLVVILITDGIDTGLTPLE